MDEYVRWLKQQNQTVYEMAGTYWREYQRALVPACPKPEPIELDQSQAEELLRKSGALFLRYFTRTVEHPTDFWFTACSEYDPAKLAQKVRANLRRSEKHCRIASVDPVWLSNNGFDCYLAAFSRYRNSKPESREKFDEMCSGAAGGPFQFWGAFVEERLVGFAKCVVGEDYAATFVLKLDPEYMQFATGSAIQNKILTTYVSQQQKTVYAGFRAIMHDTNSHDFLARIGFSRVYCDLKVVYRPAVRRCVELLRHCRPFVNRLPECPVKTNLQGLLAQEEIRRSLESERIEESAAAAV